jgi:Mrp family chromosome partitioning ATPase
MVLAGSIGGAFALAFALELFIDQTLKRPAEIETRLRLPLFLSIPYRNGDVKPKSLKPVKNLLQLAWKKDHEPPVPILNSSESAEAPALNSQISTINDQPSSIHNLATLNHQPSTIHNSPTLNSEIPPWDPGYKLRPFWDALRDRLITWFEIRGLTHKPKLVAVTSCAEGAGVSTLSTGLAATLSETGDGKVLLVDMNHQNGAICQFFQGHLTCGLEDAFVSEKRTNALVQDNLYVVSEHALDHKLLTNLPKRFKNLVPRMKVSDYDYIIFDMPPISQVSMTPRLARFMDIVLVVVESEKTDRQVVQSATTMLTESKANIGLVLNKTRTYIPRALQQEL